MGSLAVLLARPGGAGKVETGNDKDGYVANVWRAIAAAPDEVAHWADWPVNEADLHARHAWLVRQSPLLARLVDDPDFYDAKIAGWWLWGICCWIGNGWCSLDERLSKAMPSIGKPGNGIHAPSAGKKPLTHRNKGVHADSRARDLTATFEALSNRLRRVRIVCGDWKRVLGRSTLGIDTAHGMTPCGVLLDPPYAHAIRDKRLYRQDDDVSGDVRAWALENGDNPSLRIALCGFEGEHEMPTTWQCVAWKSKGSSANRGRERIWLSPHCLTATTQGELFA